MSDVQGKKEGERKEEVTKARGRKREQTDEDRTKKTSAERHGEEGAERRRRGGGGIDGAARWRRVVGDPADISRRVYEM